MNDVSYVLGPQLRRLDFEESTDGERDPLIKKSDQKSSMKKWDSSGDFGRGFSSVFFDQDDHVLLLQKSGLEKQVDPNVKLVNPDKKLSLEAAAALAKEKWRQKKSRHVSFLGSVSDTGV